MVFMQVHEIFFSVCLFMFVASWSLWDWKLMTCR